MTSLDQTPGIPAEQSGSPRSFRPDIEGLRAFAVILVLLSHAGVGRLEGGYIGVDIFFVLSGFLITGLLLKEIERTGGVSLTRFYARRARRLLPAGTLVLIVTVAASYWAIGGARADRIAVDGQWAALFVSNIRFIGQGTDYFAVQLPPSPLQHFWSLAVEEQFYVVWPALIIGVSAIGKRTPLRLRLGVVLAAVIGASVVWSIAQTSSDGTTAYFSPLTRAHELAIGALLAVVAPLVLRLPSAALAPVGWGGVVLVMAAALTYRSTTPFPGSAALLPVIGTGMIVAAGMVASPSGPERLLSIPPLQWIGKLSYSLYLWHWPLLVLAAGYAGRDLNVGENLLLCLAAVPLSAMTYALVENPVRHSAFLAARPAVVSIGLGAALVIVSAGGAALLMERNGVGDAGEGAIAMTDRTLPAEADVLRAVAEGAIVTTWPEQPKRIPNPAYSDECDVTRKDTRSSVCVHGDANADRSVVIFGDSHAAQWIPAFDLIGREQGWRVIQLTKPACQAADFPRYSETFKREYTECAEFRSFALEQIERIRPDVVIIASASKDATVAVDGKKDGEALEEAWAGGLASVIQRLKPSTGRVVVLGMMPYPSQPGIDCLTAHPNDVGACNTQKEEAVFAEHNAMEKRVAREQGAAYVDVVPWFCTDTVCPAVVGGLTTHRDGFHVAENYAVWLADVLGRATGLIPERAQLMTYSGM